MRRVNLISAGGLMMDGGFISPRTAIYVFPHNKIYRHVPCFRQGNMLRYIKAKNRCPRCKCLIVTNGREIVKQCHTGTDQMILIGSPNNRGSPIRQQGEWRQKFSKRSTGRGCIAPY